MKRIFREVAEHAAAAARRSSSTLSKSAVRDLLKANSNNKQPFEWQASDNPAFAFKGKLQVEVNLLLRINPEYPEAPLYTVCYKEPETEKVIPVMHINDKNSFEEDAFITPPEDDTEQQGNKP